MSKIFSHRPAAQVTLHHRPHRGLQLQVLDRRRQYRTLLRADSGVATRAHHPRRCKCAQTHNEGTQRYVV